MFSFTGCTGCWIDPDPMIYDQRFDKGNIITTLVTLFFVEQILDFDIQDRAIEEIRETRNFLLLDIRSWSDANLAIVIFPPTRIKKTISNKSNGSASSPNMDGITINIHDHARGIRSARGIAILAPRPSTHRAHLHRASAIVFLDRSIKRIRSLASRRRSVFTALNGAHHCGNPRKHSPGGGGGREGMHRCAEGRGIKARPSTRGRLIAVAKVHACVVFERSTRWGGTERERESPPCGTLETRVCSPPLATYAR